MLNLTKRLNFRIVSLAVAVSLFFPGTVYGIDLSKGTLRVPLSVTSKSFTDRNKNALDFFVLPKKKAVTTIQPSPFGMADGGAVAWVDEEGRMRFSQKIKDESEEFRAWNQRHEEYHQTLEKQYPGALDAVKEIAAISLAFKGMTDIKDPHLKAILKAVDPELNKAPPSLTDETFLTDIAKFISQTSPFLRNQFLDNQGQIKQEILFIVKNILYRFEFNEDELSKLFSSSPYQYPDRDDSIVHTLMAGSENSPYWVLSEQEVLKKAFEGLNEIGLVMDAGGGRGRLLKRLAELNPKEIVFVEPDRERIEAAQKLAQELGLQVRFKNQSIEYPFLNEGEKANLILCSHILQHLPVEALGPVLDNLARALSNTGKLVITAAHSGSGYEIYTKSVREGDRFYSVDGISFEEFNELAKKNIHGVLPACRFTIRTLRELLEKHGFRIEEVLIFHCEGSDPSRLEENINREKWLNEFASEEDKDGIGGDVLLVTSPLGTRFDGGGECRFNYEVRGKVDSPDLNRIQSALEETDIIQESLWKIHRIKEFDEGRIQKVIIQPATYQGKRKSVYRLTFTTKEREEIDIAINLISQESPYREEGLKEIPWLEYLSSKKMLLVPDFGVYDEEDEVYTEEFVLGKELGELLKEERSAQDVRRIIRKCVEISALVYRESEKKICLSDILPENIKIKETPKGYRAQFVGLGDVIENPSNYNVLENIYNLYSRCLKQWNIKEDQALLDSLFDGIVLILGVEEEQGREFLEAAIEKSYDKHLLVKDTEGYLAERIERPKAWIRWQGALFPDAGTTTKVKVGEPVDIYASLGLTGDREEIDKLIDDIKVEVWSDIDEGVWKTVCSMHLVGRSNNDFRFKGTIKPQMPGYYQFTVRFSIDDGLTWVFASEPTKSSEDNLYGNAYLTVLMDGTEKLLQPEREKLSQELTALLNLPQETTLDQKLKEQMSSSIQYSLASVLKTGAIAGGLSIGGKDEPYYFMNWLRDGGKYAEFLVHLYGLTGHTDLIKLIEGYIDFVEGSVIYQYPNIQRTDIYGNVSKRSWSYQNDGPAHMVRVIIDYIWLLLDKNQEQNFEKINTYYALVRHFLNWVDQNIDKPTVDLWEEIGDFSIYTDILLYDAISEGIKLANRLFDISSSEDKGFFKEDIKRWQKAKDKLSLRIDNIYWDEQKTYLTVHDRMKKHPRKPSNLDSASIGAILHIQRENLPESLSYEKIMATYIALERAFKEIYPINKFKRSEGIVFWGRYIEDSYDGVESGSLGNPWYNTTLWGIRLIQRDIILEALEEGRLLIPDRHYAEVLRNWGVSLDRFGVSEEFPVEIPSSDKRFGEIINILMATVDVNLSSLLDFVPQHRRLSEQINRQTGEPQGCRNLIWSHWEMVETIMLRGHLLAKMKDFYKSPDLYAHIESRSDLLGLDTTMGAKIEKIRDISASQELNSAI